MVSWAGQTEVEGVRREGFIAQLICKVRGDLDDDAAYKEKKKKKEEINCATTVELISCIHYGMKNDKGRQTILYLVSRT